MQTQLVRWFYGYNCQQCHPDSQENTLLYALGFDFARHSSMTSSYTRCHADIPSVQATILRSANALADAFISRNCGLFQLLIKAFSLI